MVTPLLPHPLSRQEARAAVLAMTRGEMAECESAALLTALHQRGETVEELVGAAEALREQLRPVENLPATMLDTCGTGGDGKGTFNISTAAAVVAAAAGLPVAKHGNRSITSRTGSADVLAELGVNVEAERGVVLEGLRQLGIAFFLGLLWHAAVRHVAPVRRRLPHRTLFNLLGPLCNPAGAQFQLIGTGSAETAGKLAQALARLGTRRATVVCGADGLDEVTLAADTLVWRVEGDRVYYSRWGPENFGLPRYSGNPWQANSAEASAALILRVLEGEGGPARDIVLANAAAALCTAGHAADLREGVRRAARAIEEGAARSLLRSWCVWTVPAPVAHGSCFAPEDSLSR